MKKLKFSELIPGMKLAKDIVLDDGRFLLLKGFTLRKRYLDKIRLYDIPYIYVEDEIENVEYFSEEALYSETFQTIKNIMQSVRDDDVLDVDALKKSVSEIVHQILNNDNIFMQLSGIRDIDNYTYLHSVDVCIYSIIVGKSIGLSSDVLNDLSLGAILHDVGKCKIPLEILNKPARLTQKEYEIIKKHSEYGYEIISKSSGVNENIAKIALSHHEHYDGKGYPNGIKGDEIDLLSKIVAVSDVYDALTANRVYRKKFMPHEAAEYILAHSSHQFDPFILKTFIDSIAVYPADIVVLLNTDEIARVLDSKGSASIRPKVEVITRKEGPPVLEPYEVDLMKNPSIFITDILS